MKQANKISLLLLLTIFISTLSFPSLASEKIYLSSIENSMTGSISITNVTSFGNSNYIEGSNLPTYYCKSSCEVLAENDLGDFKVQKVTDDNLAKALKGEEFYMNLLPIEGKIKVFDSENDKIFIYDLPETPIDDSWESPTYLQGSKATIDEKGIYIVYASAEPPIFDYISAVLIVDGGNDAPQAKIAVQNSSKVYVNGKETAFDAYTIDQNNYFKLRDIAMILNGSERQFEVTWDGEKNAINLESNKEYTAVGGELQQGNSTQANAILSTSVIFKDGEKIELTAYTIGQNNYFKLRDLGKAFDFGVSWNSQINSVVIDSKLPYTE